MMIIIIIIVMSTFVTLLI